MTARIGRKVTECYGSVNSMIIHLSGADTYRSAERLRELRQAFIAKHDPRGLNTVTLDADTATATELHNAITATGFFAAKRFVALNGYSANSAITPEVLVATTAKIGTGTDIIFVLRNLVGSQPAPKKRTTKTKKTAPTATRQAVQLPNEKREEFPVLSDAQLLGWIGKQVKANGTTIVPAAAQRLIAMCSRDSWRIATELDKLSAHSGGQPITVADVEALVRSEYSSDIFAVTDALGLRQAARVLQLIHQELASGTNMFSLIATLAGHIRTLYSISQAVQRGVSSTALASELGIHPFVVQKSLAQVRLFSIVELRDLHHRLVGIDHDLKTSPLDAETLMDVLLMKN